MKYIVLIHANPQPWGHPVEEFLPEYQQLTETARAQHQADFEALLGQLHADGELIGGEALGDPAAAAIYRWDNGAATRSEGPYAETKEHLAGFFLLEVGDRARAEAIAGALAGPGEAVELRELLAE